MPLRAAGEFAQVSEQIEKTLKMSGQPVKQGSMPHDHDLYMILTEAAVQLDDSQAIQKYSPLLEELAERDDHQLYLAIARRARGVACRLSFEFDQAEFNLVLANELFKKLGTNWQVGRTLIELAELDLARSDQAAARQHYLLAQESFQAVKAHPDLERTSATLENLGKLE
jgi:hypothetical protein